MKYILVTLTTLLIAFNTADGSSPLKTYQLTFPQAGDKVFLRKISQAIFQNETNCKKENLVSWNENEPFPSLGVGHAIWFPKDINPGYQESFPNLLDYLKKRLKNKLKQTSTIALPAMLSANPIGAAPWNSRAEFLSADHTELLAFLSNPEIIDLQTDFMIERMKLSLAKILQVSRENSAIASAERRRKTEQIYLQIRRLLRSEDGLLSLIDYVNFKGEGLKDTEVSPMGRHPWGLKAVLERMSETEPTTAVCNKNDLRHFNENRCANYAFAKSVRWALGRLAFTWGPEGSDARLLREKWLKGGWSRRIRETYMPGSVARISCEI